MCSSSQLQRNHVQTRALVNSAGRYKEDYFKVKQVMKQLYHDSEVLQGATINQLTEMTTHLTLKEMQTLLHFQWRFPRSLFTKELSGRYLEHTNFSSLGLMGESSPIFWTAILWSSVHAFTGVTNETPGSWPWNCCLELLGERDRPFLRAILLFPLTGNSHSPLRSVSPPAKLEPLLCHQSELVRDASD